MNNGISGFLTGPHLNSPSIAPMKRLGSFSPLKKLDRLAAKSTPQALFQELLPNESNLVNRANSRIVATYLTHFLSRCADRFDQTSISSLRALAKILSQIPQKQSCEELNSAIHKIDELATKLILLPLPIELWDIVDSYDRGLIGQMTPLPTDMTVERVEAMTPHDIEFLAKDYFNIEALGPRHLKRIDSFFQSAAKHPEKIHQFFLLFKHLYLQKKKELFHKPIRESDLRYLEQKTAVRFEHLILGLPRDLKTLNLAQCRISRKYENFLHVISKKFPCIEVLDVSQCGFDYKVFVKILGCGFCSHLRELNISWNFEDIYIIEEFIKSLSEFFSKENFPNLKLLRIQHNLTVSLNVYNRERLRRNLPHIQILFKHAEADSDSEEEAGE